MWTRVVATIVLLLVLVGILIALGGAIGTPELGIMFVVLSVGLWAIWHGRRSRA